MPWQALGEQNPKTLACRIYRANTHLIRLDDLIAVLNNTINWFAGSTATSPARAERKESQLLQHFIVCWAHELVCACAWFGGHVRS